MTPNVTRIRGVTYPSMTAAAKALGVAVATVARAMDMGTLDTCGLDRTSGLLDGVAYKSKTDAAAALNVNISTLRARIRRGKATWTPTAHA